MISSMYGSSFGYVSMTFERIARWADDLTLDFAPGEILEKSQIGFDTEIAPDLLTLF